MRKSKHGDQLSTAQAEVLRFIRTFIIEHGYPPTLREMCAERGCTSTNATHAHVRQLAVKGYIRRADGASRGIDVLLDEHGDKWPPDRPANYADGDGKWPKQLRTSKGALLERVRVDMRGVR